MSRVITFLYKFDDCELAYFKRYKLSSYLPETQKEILDYLIERGITENETQQLIAHNTKTKLTDNKERCPRCFSDKLREEKVEWMETSNGFSFSKESISLKKFAGEAHYKTKKSCNVCGYGVTDPNYQKRKPIIKKIAEYIGNVIDGIISGL